MAINKVIYNGDTLIDLSTDTVTPETLAEGVTAHDKSGAVIIGTMQSGGGDSDLPAGYRRVDYIKFTGEQIVDTGIICNPNTKIQTYFTRESSSKLYLYGVANADNSASVTAYLGGTWRFGKKYATKTTSTVSERLGYGACVNATEISVTGSITSISDVNDFETIGTLLIGSCRASSGKVGSPQFVGKIFFFAMWQGDEQVLKLVPVTDGSTYRFFDLVSKEFFDSITDTPLDGGVL